MPDQSTGVDLSVNVQTQPKARRGATAVALLSLVIGAMLGPALTNAHADTLSPTVTGATFAHNRDDDADGVPDPVTTADPLLKDASFLLGVDFTLPVPLAVGDTFAIEFPEQIQGSTNPAFPLEAADGTVIGTCAVGPVQFSCELTNPIVADWETTQPFNVYFNAQTIKGTTATTLPFTVVGGGTFEVTGPPGGIGIGAGTSFPNNPRKEGWASPDTLGAIQWVVYLPATTADSITFTDTLGTGEGQDLIVGSVRVYRTPVWNAQNIYDANTVLYPDAELDLTYGGQLQSFTISIPAHADAVAYWVAYRSTVPAGVNWGDEFSNTVSGEQVSTQETVSYNSTAGGTGGGSALPDLVITKGCRQ